MCNIGRDCFSFTFLDIDLIETMNITAIFLSFIILTSSLCVKAGPAAYGICQAGCAAVAVACYAAAGAVFGTVTAGVGTAPAILACNAAFGKCSAACILAGFAPTP